MKQVLITGCAGFIGFHTCLKMIKVGWTVYGIDCMFEDVNTDFKQKRLKQLISKGLKFQKIDLSKKSETVNYFNTVDPEVIIHLAARTGVRASIETPNAYIDANITGFCNVCEAIKDRTLHLIYASSSSVYGKSDQIPYQENLKSDAPVSVYAATKKANELLAHYYAEFYQLTMTGLRFFTVYGPWNRKDMAVYLFLDAISQQNPIRLFNHGKMKRDFTYVEDIVESIYRLAEKGEYLNGPMPQNAIFNIGYGEPVELETLVDEIQKNLNQQAIIRYEEIQQGDMINTWADNAALKALIGYSPKVSIQEGLKLTADWFKQSGQE
ncbi:MAG: SDR family NAD(P)-dependent oxidoreductase [Bacteroidota bacterium]